MQINRHVVLFLANKTDESFVNVLLCMCVSGVRINTEILILLIPNVSFVGLILTVKYLYHNSIIWGKCVFYHQQGHSRK